MLEVPLRSEPAPPGDLAYSYDEQTVRLSWTSADPAAAFRVYRADASGAEQRPSLTPTSLTVRTFTTPVEFGAERCYHVRAAVVIGPTSVESAPSRPVCFTAADTFPPAAPSALFAQPSQGRIALGWTGVASADLAGYVVLRGEGATPMMQPLFTDPIADTAFTDSTTRAGVRYTYAVVAVDKSGNRSRESNRVEEAGRF
jgi:fibronectin type 3 domain-containing protein